MDIQIGQQRKINYGSLAGYNCEVVRYNGKEKERVRIGFLQKHIMAEVSPHHLRNDI